MPLSPVQLQTLKTFLDAEAVTYGGLDDQAAAETLNAVTETRIKTSITGGEVYSATDGTEFDTKTDTQKAQWLALCGIDNIDPRNGTPGVELATTIFGGGSTTLSNLQTLRQESVSPATDQGLPRVRADDVRRARLLP